MFGYFNDRPRTWKWAVPAAIFILLIPLTGKMFASPDEELQYWASLPCGLGLLLLVVAASNYWKWATQHNAEMFTEHQTALALTPLVLLSQNMKQMHPEAVKVLNRFGVRTSWQVRVDPHLGTRDWVLADSNVHFGFIEYLLSKSNTALYPKRNFSEGSKKWDLDGIVEDREQYDEFEKWMFARMMVTRSHGPYGSAEFIPPWTPELILETLGLTGEQDLYVPEEGGRLKYMGSDAQHADGSQRSVISGQLSAVSVKKKEEQETRLLTDDEMEAIRKEEEQYAQLLQGNGNGASSNSLLKGA